MALPRGSLGEGPGALSLEGLGWASLAQPMAGFSLRSSPEQAQTSPQAPMGQQQQASSEGEERAEC